MQILKKIGNYSYFKEIHCLEYNMTEITRWVHSTNKMESDGYSFALDALNPIIFCRDQLRFFKTKDSYIHKM
jgi:hypothetical protein